MSPYPDAGDACPIGEPCVSPQIVGGIIARDNEFPWQVCFSAGVGACV